MDVAASVVGLLMAGAHVSHILQEFISSVRNAPALAQQLDNEVNHFRYILHKIQQTVTDKNTFDLERAALIDINHLASALTEAVCTFSELERELNRIQASGRLDFWDRIKWSRAEKSLLDISARLNRHETSLTLIFTILTSESLNRALSSKERLSSTFDAECLAASQADTIADSSTDDSLSSMSMSTTNPSLTSIGGREFDSALSSSRAYKRTRDSDSVFSVDTLRTPIGHWSMYTAYSNDSVFSMPISLRETSGTKLADEDVGPVLLPINVDKIYQHERYRIDPQTPSRSQTVSELRTPRYALGLAVTEGRHGEVHDLLRRGSVDSVMPNGHTMVLDVAIENQHERTLELLVMFTCDIWDWEFIGRRRFLQALKGGNSGIISTLLEHVRFESPGGAWMEQAICSSLDLENPTIISSILGKARDIPGIDTVLENVFLLPVAEGSRAALLASCAAAAGFDMSGPGMHRILRGAVQDGAKTVVKALLGVGVDVNIEDPPGQTLLHIAVKEDLESVDLQLQCGTNTERYNPKVQTPIYGAKDPTILRHLLEAGARVTTPDHTGSTVLHHAALCWTPICLDILLDYTHDINLKGENGETMLHVAALNGREDIVRILLLRHADIEARNNLGYTPLLLESLNYRPEMVQTLISLGADVDAPDYLGNTPLMRAILGTFLKKETYKVLLNNGANVNVTNNAGATPLHLAASVGHSWVVGELCRRGANRLAKDSSGRTPVEWAIVPKLATFISEWDGSYGFRL